MLIKAYIYIHLCHQKPNLARRTIPLKEPSGQIKSA